MCIYTNYDYSMIIIISIIHPKGGSSWGSEDYSQNSQDHTALHKLRPDLYSQDSTTSQVTHQLQLSHECFVMFL